MPAPFLGRNVVRRMRERGVSAEAVETTLTGAGSEPLRPTARGETGLTLEYAVNEDVLYVSFVEIAPGESASVEELDSGALLDRDAQGRELGVEFLSASRGINLAGVPRADEVRTAIEAIRRVTVRDQ